MAASLRAAARRSCTRSRCTKRDTRKLSRQTVVPNRNAIMLADEYPDMDIKSPQAYGGSPVTIHLYVADVDAFAARAMAAGLKAVRPVEDQFYGDRGGKFVDPFGHVWWLATRKETLTNEEIQQRAKAAFGG